MRQIVENNYLFITREGKTVTFTITPKKPMLDVANKNQIVEERKFIVIESSL